MENLRVVSADAQRIRQRHTYTIRRGQAMLALTKKHTIFSLALEHQITTGDHQLTPQ